MAAGARVPTGRGGKPGGGPARLERAGVPADGVVEAPEAACGNAGAPGGDPVEETRGDGPMGAGTLVVTSSKNSKSASWGGRDGSAKGNEPSSKET